MMLCLISACAVPEKPRIETCIIGEEGLLCYDPRVPHDRQRYQKMFQDSMNYECTNPTDRSTELEYWMRKASQ